jgi:catechol 2,3-dioxygenase
MSQTSAHRATGVARVDLRVDDLGAAVAFYRDVAGLEVAEHDDAHAALRAPGGPVLVALRADGVRGPAPRRATGLFHTALRYPTRAALGAALRRVVAAGAGLQGASDHGVSEALYLDDPAGNGVELYWDRPRVAWPPPGPGERVGMFTAPLDLAGLAAQADPGAGGAGVDIGHVHLKVGDVDAAVGFATTTLGLELMQRFGDQAAFLAAGGYHHHLGVNTWLSHGARPGPPDLAGLDRVVLVAPDDDEPARVQDPDGLEVLLAPGGAR